MAETSWALAWMEEETAGSVGYIGNKHAKGRKAVGHRRKKQKTVGAAVTDVCWLLLVT